jgi:hypothetical protein
MSTVNICYEHSIVISRPACPLSMAKVVSITIQLVDSVTSDSVNSSTFQCAILAVSISPFSWSHILMTGEDIDVK